MSQASRPLDYSFRDELLRDPENAAFYLEQVLEGGDIQAFQEALLNVAKAQEGGVSAVAKKAKLNRENLYDALSRNGKPQMETVTKTLSALSLRISITADHR